MKIRPEQLDAHLKKALAPIYLAFGDEPLLVQEARDAVRAAAHERGHDERLVMEAEAGFDWDALRLASDNLSLFTQRRLIDLRLHNAGPGQAGGRALADYAARPPEDTVLLVSAGKLDKKAQGSEWFKALEQHGITVAVWPVTAARLPAWTGQRLRARGLQADEAAVSLIAGRTEGNLLATMQEIEKLCLLYDGGRVGAREVAQAVGDSARFSVYDLADTALAGDTAKVVRIVEGLRGEGVEPVLVLWALAREIRQCCQMARDRDKGLSVDKVLAAHRVWDKRKSLAKACLARYPARTWCALLHQAARVDRILKGGEAGSVWHELLKLGVSVAGAPVVPAGGLDAPAVTTNR